MLAVAKPQKISQVRLIFGIAIKGGHKFSRTQPDLRGSQLGEVREPALAVAPKAQPTLRPM